ncbi:MAG: hypothetical protein QM722_22965 [Piscinibacter sp.]
MNRRQVMLVLGVIVLIAAVLRTRPRALLQPRVPAARRPEFAELYAQRPALGHRRLYALVRMRLSLPWLCPSGR